MWADCCLARFETEACKSSGWSQIFPNTGQPVSGSPLESHCAVSGISYTMLVVNSCAEPVQGLQGLGAASSRLGQSTSCAHDANPFGRLQQVGLATSKSRHCALKAQ